MGDIDHRRDEHRHRECHDDRQDPERPRRSPGDVDQTDGHRDAERAEMAGIVDRGGAVTEQQTRRSQHQLGGRDRGERQPDPLAAAHTRRMRPRKDTAREIRDGLGEPYPQDTVDLTDLGPPRLTRRASSEVRVGQDLFLGGRFLIELRRQQLTECCTVHVRHVSQEVGKVPHPPATLVRMLDLDRLATAAATGDRVALDRFVRSIQADVWRFCAHLTRPAEADDLAQESLVRIVTHLQRWERGPVMTWVLGVSRNVCFEHLRKRTRRRTDPVADFPTRSAPDAHSAVETTQLLDALPLDQREAIVLTQLIGLPYAQAAEVIGCPIGTIRSRVARGRGSLAEALREARTGTGEA